MDDDVLAALPQYLKRIQAMPKPSVSFLIGAPIGLSEEPPPARTPSRKLSKQRPTRSPTHASASTEDGVETSQKGGILSQSWFAALRRNTRDVPAGSPNERSTPPEKLDPIERPQMSRDTSAPREEFHATPPRDGCMPMCTELEIPR